jgi:hypothetical protein
MLILSFIVSEGLLGDAISLPLGVPGEADDGALRFLPVGVRLACRCQG